jgi:DNA-binding MarR family transcriptional regulator
VDESPFRHDNVLFRFFRITQSMRRLVARALEGTDLSTDEYGVFSGIVGLGPVSPTELANALGVPPTTISVYLARFLERGLVQRLPNPGDGRSYLVEATEQGRALVLRVGPRLRVEADAIMAASDLSFDELMRALGTLEQAARSAVDADTTNV